MSYYLDEEYYLRLKTNQMAKAGIADENGDPFTSEGMLQIVLQHGMTISEHYERFGRTEGLNPNPYFNELEYLEAKVRQLNSLDQTDEHGNAYTTQTLLWAMARDGMTPVEHYALYGCFETDSSGYFINPSNAFDANAYMRIKLLLARQATEEINGHSGEDITMEDLVLTFQEGGLSPVNHYAQFGAQEATAAGTAFVQTVPMAQRVRNDTGRLNFADTVPSNYNQPVPPPYEVDTPTQLIKPADVGGLVGAEISPDVIFPSGLLPVPGDAGYSPAPPGLIDQTGMVVVPPTTRDTGMATDDWVIVSLADMSGTVIKPDGSLGGALSPNSVDSDFVIPSVRPVVFSPVYVKATEESETVHFVYNKADTFETEFGVADVFEVQSVNLANVSLGVNHTFSIVGENGEVWIINNTAGTLTGESLAEFIATSGIAPEGWTLSYDGARLVLTSTERSDPPDLEVSYTASTREVQSIDLAEVTLHQDESLTINGSVFFTNMSVLSLSGEGLAQAVVSDGNLSGWRVAVDGSVVTFTDALSGVDQENLVITYGPNSTPITVAEDVQGTTSTSTELIVSEDVKGVPGIDTPSSLTALDTIVGFDVAQDKIILPTPVNILTKGLPLMGITVDDFKAVAGEDAGKIGAHEAGLFVRGEDYYLLINDEDASFNPLTDVVVKLVGFDLAQAAAMTVGVFDTP